MARATRASGERNPKAQRDPLGAFELKHLASCVRRVVCDGQCVVSAGRVGDRNPPRPVAPHLCYSRLNGLSSPACAGLFTTEPCRDEQRH